MSSAFGQPSSIHRSIVAFGHLTNARSLAGLGILPESVSRYTVRAEQFSIRATSWTVSIAGISPGPASRPSIRSTVAVGAKVVNPFSSAWHPWKRRPHRAVEPTCQQWGDRAGWARDPCSCHLRRPEQGRPGILPSPGPQGVDNVTCRRMGTASSPPWGLRPGKLPPKVEPTYPTSLQGRFADRDLHSRTVPGRAGDARQGRVGDPPREAPGKPTADRGAPETGGASICCYTGGYEEAGG